MLPTFLVIGAMKSGTTSLHGYLAAHPEVFMTERKELHFFSVASNWERGQDWYEAQFAAAGDAAARGESSPSYSQADIFRGVPARIAAMLPAVRLVYIVRHPIERIRSMYLHLLASGREDLPIADALRKKDFYVNASRYAWQLDQHLEHVPRDRVKVLTTDGLRDHPAETLADVYDFLGVDSGFVPGAEVRRGETENKRVATGLRKTMARVPGRAALKRLVPEPVRAAVRTATTRPVTKDLAELPADVEAELIEALRPDVARLRQFLGADFDGWGLIN